METSISGPNHVVFACPKRQVRAGPIETCISGAKVAVLKAKNHR